MSLGLGLAMLPSLGVALLYGEPGWSAFAGGAFLSVILGGAAFFILRQPQARELSHREGLAIVGLGWLLAGVLGGVPLYLSGDFASFTDAVFESASGFTTTGASVLTNVEAAQKCVLFWRAFTHWLGGMGFIVLSLAILPFVGVGGMQLFKAEVPSPTPDRLAPRIADTAAVLWKVYALLTLAETVLLMFGGLDWFDAVCHAFATLATGGFSTKNASVGHWPSPYVQWVITIFMYLAGINFTLHFLILLQRRWNAWWRDEEFRWYTGISLGAVVLITVGLMSGQNLGLEESLRLAAFQTATILTTTGFATVDYSLWPALPLAVLVIMLFIGGSAGSTGGGPKVMRIMVMLKQSGGEFLRLVHPRLVKPVKLGRRTADKNVVNSIWAFLGLYLACFGLTGLGLALLGVDVTTAYTASIACLGNIGPGLGEVGPAGNYAAMPLAGKWLLTLAMLVGRLEIYPLLILLVPEFWRS
ncbi:MAG: TrkH family potassium uptake protein [Deltaproteobacteria bacterium]|nr:TrkH family potassium uptake protein [Deltaproteobacteria bacterium]